jgi:hypothetical protein
MIKRVATVTLTVLIQTLMAAGYLIGLIAALFGVIADCLDRVRTRINTPVEPDVDPYDDIHNADDPNITKNYKNNE